jgi:hypothetical protein
MSDNYTEETITIPYLIWETEETIVDTYTNTSYFVVEREGTLCRERIGQLSYYLRRPTLLQQDSEDELVMVDIRYRDSPHITYGDMQKLIHVLASKLVGHESVTSSPVPDDDKESLGTLDDICFDEGGEDGDEFSMGDENQNDDPDYDSNDDNYF